VCVCVSVARSHFGSRLKPVAEVPPPLFAQARDLLRRTCILFVGAAMLSWRAEQKNSVAKGSSGAGTRGGVAAAEA